uniref:NADH-ubiquinone oxidoreductase chain 6 n=1 Tax=Cyclorhipidion bodoanum TaxID=2566501 RepID=A0A343A6P6_9CUCU|nr:NADH dehydrogenase subunit 6 [Cyclorhipidion bodoanus]AOY40251.1 NADH dehydrogenase subunit 6 [Cyclorhipidion bodoanus]
MYLNCILSIMLMIFKTPLSKGYILLLLTISTSLSSSLMYLSSWFGYILFLIMVGGMLVAFIYMTSVASNEKFKFPKMNMLMMFSMIMLTLFCYMNLNYYDLMNNFNQMMLQSQEIISSSPSTSLSKIFSSPMNHLPISLMSYLLLTLIMVVKMTEFIKGPIRQK